MDRINRNEKTKEKNKKSEDKIIIVDDKWSGFPIFTDQECEEKFLILNGLNEKTDKKEIERLMTETFRFRRNLDDEILKKFVRFEDVPFLVSMKFHNFFK